MTIYEANSIRNRFEDAESISDDDFFLYTEALHFLINETKDPNCILELGGAYYERKDYGLALKYYELAAAAGNEYANVCLGYIWYYGRTGTVNYMKAFEYFSAVPHDINAQYKIADMYRNGYYVQKNYEKYKEIIERVYRYSLEENEDIFHLPEIYIRIGEIRRNEGRTSEAIELYLKAKNALISRIDENAFFGNLNIMKELINELYSLISFNIKKFDLYDLFELLKKPVKVSFWYLNDLYIIESIEEDDEIIVHFGDSWYRTIDDFFEKANINGIRIVSLRTKLKCLEVYDGRYY